MRLSKKAQYGTRAMLDLALNHGRGLTSLSRIARGQGISVKYLEQLFRSLRRAGMVEGVRGVAGGYRLKRPPGEIRMGDVIRALEEPMSPVACLDDSALCDRWEGCQARDMWIYLSQAIQRALDEVTLEGILRRRLGEERG
jgi:Rrf2 family protein